MARFGGAMLLSTWRRGLLALASPTEGQLRYSTRYFEGIGRKEGPEANSKTHRNALQSHLDSETDLTTTQ